MIGAVASASCQTVAPAFTAIVGDHLVEVATAHDVSERGQVGMLGPLELERDAVGEGAQAVEAVEVRRDARRGPCRAAGAPRAA